MPSGALQARPRSSSAADVRCVPGFGSLLLAPSHRGLVRICSASAVGALGPQHLGGVFLVENLVAVAAFKCLLDHGGLLFRRGDAFWTRRRSRVLPSTWKSAAAFSGKCEMPGRSGIGGLADMELGMRLAAWRAWRRRAACGLVGDAGNAWCSKCWLCWRGLAVEMLRAWVRGNVARAACDLVCGPALVAVLRVR